MNNYTIDFYNVKPRSREHLERVEMQRPAFTSRELKTAVQTLLWYTSDREYVTAEICRNDQAIVVLRTGSVAWGPYCREVSVEIARPREKFRTIRKTVMAALNWRKKERAHIS